MVSVTRLSLARQETMCAIYACSLRGKSQELLVGVPSDRCAMAHRALTKDFGFTLFQNEHPITHAGGSRRDSKALERLFHGLVRKPERSIVHWDHDFRAHIEKRLQRVFGTCVDIAIMRRVIGADRQQCQFGAQAAADLAKAIEVCSVPRVI